MWVLAHISSLVQELVEKIIPSKFYGVVEIAKIAISTFWSIWVSKANYLDSGVSGSKIWFSVNFLFLAYKHTYRGNFGWNFHIFSQINFWSTHTLVLAILSFTPIFFTMNYLTFAITIWFFLLLLLIFFSAFKINKWLDKRNICLLTAIFRF